MFDNNHLDRLLSIRQSFDKILQEDTNKISPQLKKRFQLLIESLELNSIDAKSYQKILDKTSSLFKRMLLEILQAHYNTKQREHDAKRLIESKNCILEPNLTDTVINLLVKLNRADGVKCDDNSYERKVLIKFLLKELNSDQKYAKNQIEKVIQTLYRCSCFDIITRQAASGSLKLKEGLQNSSDIRMKHDIELIKLVQSYKIRLSPESWAFLLYRSSNPEILSRIQSLLDKNQNPVTIDELHEEILKVDDKYNIKCSLKKLQQIHDLIEDLSKSNDLFYNNNEIEILESLLNDLLELRHLFTIRQTRAEYS